MAVTLTNIKDAVLIETGRVDKDALIERAVKNIVLMAHKIDFFPEDRKVDDNVVPGTPALVISEALPLRWRKFSLIEPLTSGGIRYATEYKRHFHVKDPENIFDFNNEIVTEYFYVLGQTVVMESDTQIDRLRWVWYEYPDIATMSNSTWLTNLYEQELIDGVCAYVYRKLGDIASARSYHDLWREHRQRIQSEHLIEAV